MTRPFAARRLAAACAVGLAAVLGTAVVQTVFSTSAPPPSASQPLPPVQHAPIGQTDLEQAKTALGPFATIVVDADSPNPDTQYPAVLLLNQDRSVQASQRWTVPFSSATWTQQNVFQIQSLSIVNGYATFGVGNQRVYTVRCGQPFLLEEQPQMVAVIDAQGQQWSITTIRAEVLRKAL